jgi:hypothetical protein
MSTFWDYPIVGGRQLRKAHMDLLGEAYESRTGEDEE